ncbi:MAG: hypothetical protein P0107_00995 [Nitrosomonas sp.]|nr:hypothetical protein [Nitrosomonas sp.]
MRWRVPAGIAAGEQVHVVDADKQLAAKIVKYPFVRNGQELV